MFYRTYGEAEEGGNMGRSDDNGKEPLFCAYLYKYVSKLFQAQRDAINHRVVRQHIKSGTKFDVVLMYGFCEVGLYLGRKIFKAPLVYLVRLF